MTCDSSGTVSLNRQLSYVSFRSLPFIFPSQYHASCYMTTMKFTSAQSLLLALTAWLSIKKSYIGAFVPSRSYYCYHHTVRHLQSTRLRFAAPDETTDDDPNNDQEEDDDSRRVPNDLGLNIVRGSPSDIPDDIWEDIEGGAPSRWMVMKDVSNNSFLLTFCITIDVLHYQLETNKLQTYYSC